MMRWLLREPGGPEPASAGPQGTTRLSPATAGAASEPGGRDTASWRRLPPLTPTAAQSPPLLSAGLLTLPDISGTRSLLRPSARPQVPQARPLRSGDGPAISGDEAGTGIWPSAGTWAVSAGLVHGLVMPRAGVPAPGPATSPDNLLGHARGDLPDPFRRSRRAGLIHRILRLKAPPSPDGLAPDAAAPDTAATAAGVLPAAMPPRRVPHAVPGGERRVLTEVTADYVGEPQEGAEPYRPSAWLRATMAIAATRPGAGDPEAADGPWPAGGGQGESPSVAGYLAGGAAGAQPGGQPWVAGGGVAGTTSAPTGSGPARGRAPVPGGRGGTGELGDPLRRANLAQSRRLGLGPASAKAEPPAAPVPAASSSADTADRGAATRNMERAAGRKTGNVAGGNAGAASADPECTARGAAAGNIARGTDTERGQATPSPHVPPGGAAGAPPRLGLGAPLAPGNADTSHAEPGDPGRSRQGGPVAGSIPTGVGQIPPAGTSRLPSCPVLFTGSAHPARRPGPVGSGTEREGRPAGRTASGSRSAGSAANRLAEPPGEPYTGPPGGVASGSGGTHPAPASTGPAAVLPVYRSALAASPLPAARPRAASGRRARGHTARSMASPPGSPGTPRPLTAQAESVPGDLASAFARARGVDVSRVPVYRDPMVTAQAQTLRARAFTRDGAVFLPGEAGPLSQRSARALLAHELAHVAQQGLLGDGLPEEGSADGLALEADAMATERWAAGDAAPPPPLTGLPGLAIPPALTVVPGRAPERTPVTHARNAPSSGTGTPRRAPLQADALPVPASPAPADPAAAGAAAGAAVPAAVISSALPQPQAPPPPEVAVTAAQALPDTELAAARDRLLALAAQRPLDMDDPADLDELAGRLYPRLHRELRLELLVDRERSGLLSDFR